MRNLLALSAFAVLTFAVLGWYLDWYHIQSAPSSTGHQSVNIDINSGKILQDVNKARQKLAEERKDSAVEVQLPEVGKQLVNTPQGLNSVVPNR